MSAPRKNAGRLTLNRMGSRWRYALVLAAMVIAVAMPVKAAEIDMSDVPLFITTQVQPNIMLVLDNSGSMNNVVPDSPYDVNGTYGCTGTVQDNNYQIDIFITSAGVPYFRRGSSGTTYYDWGTGGENGATGRSKRCFTVNESYVARLYGNGGTATGTKSPDGYLPAEYTGHYLNWYFGTNTSNSYGTQSSNFGSQARIKPGVQNRMSIAQNAAKSLVDSLGDVRLGLATYYGDNGGSLREIIGDLDSTKKTAIKSKIDALSPSGMTPLAETLSDIGRYFTTGYTGSLTLHPGQSNQSTASVANVFNNHIIRNDSGQTITAPIQYSCQKCFAVYLTDGRPQGDQNISSYLSDYDGDCFEASPQCLTYDRKPDREYESAGSDYLDDVAQALYEIDLRPDLVDPLGVKNNVATYMIGFADDQAKNDPLMQDAADQGGGLFYTAGNESELVEAFLAAARNIMGTIATAASIATNTTRLGTDTLIYQAMFDSDGWNGRVVAYEVNPDGSVGALHWDTDTYGQIPYHTNRNIYTWNNSTGVLFSEGTWGSLHSDQRDALVAGGTEENGTDRLNWIRGDHSNEKRFGGTLRNRTRLQNNVLTDWVLGDIVNSDPVYVAVPNFGYDRLPAGTAADTYKTFREKNMAEGGFKDRRKMLYIGANDGMLHAFDALTGVEVFAYVPKGVFPQLSSLTDPDYTHKYFVDGTATVGDAFLDGAWKSILVGTTGAGGRTVFALDVTNPDAFNGSKVLWEFTDADLGYTLGQAVIGRMATGDWVAIFGNGYGSDNHKAFLYIVNLQTGALIRKIDTGAGDIDNLNGLATPALLANSNRIIQTAYAGDLLGNLWKFDLSDPSDTNWDVAFESGTKLPLFQAMNDAGQRQPITAPIEIMKHPNGGHLILFGTGKYFESGDNLVSADPPVQSFYGIWDDGTRIATTDRSELQEQQIVYEDEWDFIGPEGTETWPIRLVSKNSVDYVTSPVKRGWFMDLVTPTYTSEPPDFMNDSPVNIKKGERVVSAPLIRSGRVIFTTIIPSSDPCAAGGSSWLMEVDALTGGRLGHSVFDLNLDKLFDDGDWVHGFPVSGLQPNVGMIKTPAVISAGEIEYKFAGGSSGAIQTIVEKGGENLGRQSWRQLR
jgi:type IV pilus assembly protein PilY1